MVVGSLSDLNLYQKRLKQTTPYGGTFFNAFPKTNKTKLPKPLWQDKHLDSRLWCCYYRLTGEKFGSIQHRNTAAKVPANRTGGQAPLVAPSSTGKEASQPPGEVTCFELARLDHEANGEVGRGGENGGTRGEAKISNQKTMVSKNTPFYKETNPQSHFKLPPNSKTYLPNWAAS